MGGWEGSEGGLGERLEGMWGVLERFKVMWGTLWGAGKGLGGAGRDGGF